jgi:hypothetical protein
MDYIKINNEDYPITVNMNVYAAIIDHTGLKLTDIFKLHDVMKMSDVLYFIWASVKEGCRIEKKPYELTVEDVGAGADAATIAEFYRIFINSQTPADGKDGKKKVTPAKAPKSP